MESKDNFSKEEHKGKAQDGNFLYFILKQLLE